MTAARPRRYRYTTRWYVDNSLGTGSNNGTSWANAWRTISAINWASINGGDVVYISGGASSQVYNEAMTISKSGTSATRPITVTGAPDSGKNGEVIFDGGNGVTTLGSSSALITNSSAATNLIIQKMTLRNTLENCLYWTGVTSGSVIIQNMTIHTGGTVSMAATGTSSAGASSLTVASVTGTWGTLNFGGGNVGVYNNTTPSSLTRPTYVTSASGTTVNISPNVVSTVSSGNTLWFGYNARGVRLSSNTGGSITVRNCTIDTDALSPSQNDGIFTSANGTSCTILLENNTITINNADPSGHSDTWQSFQDGNVTARNNLLYHPNGGVNNHGMWLSDTVAGGTLTVYNNVIDMGNATDRAITHWRATGGFTGKALIYNNTIVNSTDAIYLDTTASTTEVKNNIISVPSGQRGFVQTGVTLASGNINNNLMYGPTTGSANNLTASNTSGASIGGVRSTTSKSTGLHYYEVTVGGTWAGSNSAFGIANATQSLTAFWGNSGNNSMGYFSNGLVYINGGNTSIQTYTTGQVVAVALDATNKKLWFKNLTTSSGWNNDVIGNQNPASNVGGKSITAITGNYFAGCSISGNGDNVTFNFGATTFTGTMPSGYSAWGSGTTLNPSDIASPVTLSPAENYTAATSGGTNYTWSGWKGLGYDAAGVQGDPALVNVASHDYHLQSSSVARGAASVLATVTIDADEYVRPGASPDIGAYQYR